MYKLGFVDFYNFFLLLVDEFFLNPSIVSQTGMSLFLNLLNLRGTSFFSNLLSHISIDQDYLNDLLCQASISNLNLTVKFI